MKSRKVVPLFVVFLACTASAGPKLCCYRSFNREIDTTRTFADMGITVRAFTAGNTIGASGKPYVEYPPIWNGIDDYDWDSLDRAFDDILAVCPNERFVVVVDLNTPWWLTRRTRFDSFNTISIAAADDEWRKITLKWMRDFLGHTEEKYGSCIVAYLLACGSTTEWEEYWRGTTSIAFDEKWRKWCAANGVDYGMGVPCYASLTNAVFENAVYDPSREPEKIEYWRFRNALVADTVCAFAKEARGCIGADKQIGTFFGYYLLCVPHLYNSWNHMEYERVFSCPDIDFIAAPATYKDRGCGGPVGALLLDGTLRRYGKRYFHEIDMRPHDFDYKHFKGASGWFKTEEDDIAGNMREAGFALTHNASMWWFDMWGGFYNSKSLRQRIGRIGELVREFGNEDPESLADVLFIGDPQSAYYTNERAAIYLSGPDAVRNLLAKTGLVADYYSFNDIKTLNLSKYKAVVFPMQPCITDEQMGILRKYVCREGRTVVWHHAAGITDGKTLDVERVKALTGVAYGTPGITVTEMDGWRSVYVPDYATFTHQTMREILERSGAHAWTDGISVVHANAKIVYVHCGKDEGGRRIVHLPYEYDEVVDLLSGEVLAREASDVQVEFANPDTRILGLRGQRDKRKSPASCR